MKVYERKINLRRVDNKKIYMLFLSFCLLITIPGCLSKTKEVKSTLGETSPMENSVDNNNTLPIKITPVPNGQKYFIKGTDNRPYAVGFDKMGAMYMVTAPSSGSGTLSKVSPAGEIQVLATLDGSFIGPGIDVDKDGNAYITVGDKLLKASPKGKITVVSEGFSRCIDVKLDSKGNLFVADDTEDTIYKITPSGGKSVFYKGEKIGAFVLTSLIFDKNYKYLYAREKDTILKFDMSGHGSEIKPEIVVNEPGMFYVCMDAEDNMYVSMPRNNVVKRVGADGNSVDINTSPIREPIGLAAGGKGFDENCIYVADALGIIEIPK